jgi:hypothetical protein
MSSSGIVVKDPYSTPEPKRALKDPSR